MFRQFSHLRVYNQVRFAASRTSVRQSNLSLFFGASRRQSTSSAPSKLALKPWHAVLASVGAGLIYAVYAIRPVLKQRADTLQKLVDQEHAARDERFGTCLAEVKLSDAERVQLVNLWQPLRKFMKKQTGSMWANRYRKEGEMVCIIPYAREMEVPFSWGSFAETRYEELRNSARFSDAERLLLDGLKETVIKFCFCEGRVRTSKESGMQGMLVAEKEV